MILCLILLVIIVVFLLLKLMLIYKSIDEISDTMEFKLQSDTNSLITVSSSDIKIRELASRLNDELVQLNTERHTLQSGNTELRNAVTNAAHDLRTPLTAICGYLELLQQQDVNEKCAGYITIISERTEVLKSLTEELFRYSVMSSGPQNLELENVSMNMALETAIAGAYHNLADRGIQPDISITKNTVYGYADKKALSRIFENILSNAVKYSDGDLSIVMDDSGLITFSNRASSLSQVQAEQLFDRFYTVENAKGSTGLGLSIAKLLTEKMSGKIYSEYHNGRLSICVVFPDK